MNETMGGWEKTGGETFFFCLGGRGAAAPDEAAAPGRAVERD